MTTIGKNSSDRRSEDSPIPLLILLVVFVAAFPYIAYEVSAHHALSSFDLKIFIASGASFALSLVLAGILPQRYFSDHPVLNWLLAALAILVLVVGAYMGVRVGINTYDAPHKGRVHLERLIWRSDVQGFITFFSLLPVVLLFVDTRTRAIRAQSSKRLAQAKAECLKHQINRGCKVQNEHDGEERRPPTVLTSLAVVFVVCLLLHDLTRADLRQSRRQRK